MVENARCRVVNGTDIFLLRNRQCTAIVFFSFFWLLQYEAKYFVLYCTQLTHRTDETQMHTHTFNRNIFSPAPKSHRCIRKQKNKVLKRIHAHELTEEEGEKVEKIVFEKKKNEKRKTKKSEMEKSMCMRIKNCVRAALYGMGAMWCGETDRPIDRHRRMQSPMREHDGKIGGCC